MDIKKEDYIFIDVEWHGGFKHSVPCRGYDLQSQLKFQKSIFWIKQFTYRVVTKKQYEDRIWSPLVADIEKTTSTNTTQSPRKNGQSEKKDGKKQLATKPSVKTAIKDTNKKATSSTRTRKPRTGS